MKTAIPDWLKDHVVEQCTLTYKGEEYTYVVVSSAFGTAQGVPEMFTIMNGGVLAVSDAYPKEWRELGLIHEIIENTSGDLDEGSCARALHKELELAGESGIDMPSYVAFRLSFFEGLIGYYSSKTRVPAEDELLKRLLHSRDHLLGPF